MDREFDKTVGSHEQEVMHFDFSLTPFVKFIMYVICDIWYSLWYIYRTYGHNPKLNKICNDVDELDVVLNQLLEGPPDPSEIPELRDEEAVNPILTGNGGLVTRLG